MWNRAAAVLDALDEGILLVDHLGTVITTNEPFCAMVGLARPDVVGASPPYPWWPEGGLDERVRRLLHDLAARSPIQHPEVQICRPDGTVIIAEARLHPVRDTDESVMNYREVTEEVLRNRRLVRLVETTNALVLRLGVDGTITYVSDGAAAIAGAPPDQVARSSVRRFIHPDDLPSALAALERVRAGGVATHQYRLRSASGEMYWLEGTWAPIAGADGAVAEIQVVSRDITEQIIAEQMNAAMMEVVDSEARGGDRLDLERTLAQVVHRLTAAVSVQILRSGPDGLVATAWWPDEDEPPAAGAVAARAVATGTPVRDVAPDRQPIFAAPLVPARGEPGVIYIEGASAPRWPQIAADFARRVAIVFDAVEDQERMRQLADTDPLTGLANRRAIAAALKDAIIGARRGETAALAVIDIDGLKEINDRGGHAGGDGAIVRVAECMRDTARAGDTLGRFGGDEFAWLIAGSDLESATAAAERLRSAIGTGGSAGPLTLSLGVAAVRADDDVDSLLRRADGLLYTAKAKGRDRTEPGT